MNSIVINASETELDVALSGLYVSPVRNDTISGNTLVYNTSTKEIVYNTAKTFVITHPVDEDKYLVHSTIEGPENGVFYRGRGEIVNNEHVQIKLPSYVNKLAKNFTIQVNRLYDGRDISLSTSEVNDGSTFTVYGENGKFHWIVFGDRGDEFEVEPKKSEYSLNGDGPYKYLSKNVSQQI